MKISAVLLFLWFPVVFAQTGGQGLVATFRQNCTIAPPTPDLTVIAKLLKAEAEIARHDLGGEFVKPMLLREKETLEAEMNLVKSKCLIKQMTDKIGSDVSARKMESTPEYRSLLSQLSIYQGMVSRELERFRDSEPCLDGTRDQRLKCIVDTQKKIAHVQASLNAVEFYLDMHRWAIQRNPNLTLAEIGEKMEKRFQKDIDYLKNLPEPGEDPDDVDAVEFPPSPSIDDLFPGKGAK